MTKKIDHTFHGEGEEFARIWSEAQIKSFHENLSAEFEKSGIKRPDDENQEKRANTGYKGEIMIDSVSAAFLKRKMLPEDLKIFVDLMISQETPAHAELDDDSITDKTRLPEGMIDARIVNGRIITKTAIGEDVYLVSDRVEIIGRNINKEALKNAIGKPVSDLVKNDFFSSKVIVRSIDTQESTSVLSEDVISLVADLPLVKLTSLIPTKRVSVTREKARMKMERLKERTREKA